MKKKNNTLILSVVSGAVFIAAAMLFVPKNETKFAGAAFLERYNGTPNAVMVDVRTPAEFSAGHIEKAINIDFENQSFVEEIKKLDTTKAYFVYCRSGNRSGQAVPLMKAAGIKNISELQGGIVSNGAAVSLVTANNQ